MRLRGTFIHIAVLVGVALSWSPAAASPPLPPLYNPAGMDAWDYWFARINGVYHAFYLQTPLDAPVRFANPRIGMATSPDLLHWTEYGEVLAPNPPGNPWSDAWVATGSTFYGPQGWMMAFTGVSTNGVRGMGMARSDDFEHWTKLANTGPIPITKHPFVVPESDYWQDRGFAIGQVLDYMFIADPCVLPEPIDGWYYMVYSAIITNPSMLYHGCTVLSRSQDCMSWDDVTIVSAPAEYEECEAPQLWKRGDRWHLLFGAARAEPLYRATMVFTAATMEGPFEPPPVPEITIPDPGWFYVGKVLPDPKGDDVLMAYHSGAVSRPYPVNYDYDGSTWIGAYDDAFSQWLPGGLATYAGPLVSDMGGGVIAKGNYRLNGNGADIWGPIGSTTATAWASDGRGGAIGAGVASGNIFAIRTTMAGARPWGSSANVCNAAQSQTNPVVVPDGAGGAFFAWVDYRNGVTSDIYVQHLNAAGTAVWTSNGIPVCTAAGNQSSPAIAPDGLGGLLITWQDDRPTANAGADIYAQRLIPSGTAVWAANGIAVAGVPGIEQTPVIVSDGTNGAFIGWRDDRNGEADVYVQRVTSDGFGLWTPGGLPACAALGDQILPVLERDGASGVFIAWEDHRAGGAQGLDIYAQRLAATDGAPQWAPDGAPVCTNALEQVRPSLVLDGAGGIVVVWMDARDDVSPTQTFYVPYGQRLNAAGAPNWMADGVRIETSQGTTSPAAPSIATDFEGGAFVSGTAGLQRLLPDGRMAWMVRFAPTLMSVRDAPDDDGGLATLTFMRPASEQEQLNPAVIQYDVWRKVGPGSAAFPPVGWEMVATTSPNSSLTRTLIVPTRADSTGVGPVYETFCVVSNTSSPALLLPSEVAVGYSVDDIAPLEPTGLVGGFAPGVIHLAWAAGPEPDIDHYEVYRGSAESFVPSAANRIGLPTDPAFTDSGFAIDSLYYKVVTVDTHGNVSPATSITPFQIAASPEGGAKSVTFLGRVSPNPIRSSASIEYGLARETNVSLAVFDLAGRRVRTLVDGRVAAGARSIRWDGRDDADRRLPAGVYLVRLMADGVHRTAKVVSAH